MLTGFRHLALEVKYLDRARAFYAEWFGLTPARETAEELVYDVGETSLVLRRPSTVPRGGLHTHYAFSAPASAYDAWRDRLDALDPTEHSFGSSQSVYVDDPDDHCVEVGGVDDPAGGGGPPTLTGIFEVVLEVEDLDAAVDRYRTLGFDVVDRGRDRRRVRLSGPVDLELWEPQLGLADARGGVHVDLGFSAPDPTAALSEFDARARTCLDDAIRVSDPDGHYVTVSRESL